MSEINTHTHTHTQVSNTNNNMNTVHAYLHIRTLQRYWFDMPWETAP